MFDKQHKSPALNCRVPSRSGNFAKNHPGSLPWFIWNIAARSTPSSRRRTAFLEVERPLDDKTIKSGDAPTRRPQRIPSYGWSIRHWRNSRNRQRTRVCRQPNSPAPSGYCVVTESLGTLLHITRGTNPDLPRDEFGLAVGEFPALAEPLLVLVIEDDQTVQGLVEDPLAMPVLNRPLQHRAKRQ